MTGRVKIPLERNPVSRKVEICLPAWWKLVGGALVSALFTGLTAGTAALWSMAIAQAETKEAVENVSTELSDMDDRHIRELNMIHEDIREIRGRYP